MKLAVKTLKGGKFEIDVPEESTVEQVKAAIVRPRGFSSPPLRHKFFCPAPLAIAFSHQICILSLSLSLAPSSWILRGATSFPRALFRFRFALAALVFFLT
jgi:hypothetical protein